MVVVCLQPNPAVYSCRSYLVLGSWNTLEDVNTVIDPGTDGHVIAEIDTTSTGVGKKPVQQILLTHSHFDHAGGIPALKKRYGCEARGVNPMPGIDRGLRDGEHIMMGDRWFQVIHLPGHSNDSVCFYSPDERALFSGDSPLVVRTPGGSYHEEFVNRLSQIAGMRIDVIYPGHDDPIRGDIRALLYDSLRNIRNSTIIR